eukprot:gene17807-21238_t
MKLKFIMLLIIGSTMFSNAQSPARKNHFGAWTYHQKNVNINGLSVGAFSEQGEDQTGQNVHTNGIKIEALGLGILLPLVPRSPLPTSEKEFATNMNSPVSERINGLNLSGSGTICDCITNGISAGFIAQFNRQINGISASLMGNLTQKHNGIQLALFFNESYVANGFQIGFSNSGKRVRGLQIGVFNESDNMKGIQLGVWNKNQKRKMPIINWNFKG